MSRCTRFVNGSSALLLGLLAQNVALADSPQRLPAPMLDSSKAAAPMQMAVLAGGCFWGVQGVFQHLRGVRSVVSGYAGGQKSTAHYDMVSSGSTGHAESVQIRFDPQAISYGEILRIFFSVVHDPTELNRQGPDTGPQYRSSIFYASDSQAAIARAYIGQLQKARVFRGPIVTRVDALKGFYPAEDSHQDFLINYPDNPYIVENDLPKIRNLKDLFAEYYRDEPVRVADIPVPITVGESKQQQ